MGDRRLGRRLSGARACAATVAIAGALAGCAEAGGGGPSREDYVRAGNAICREGDREVERALAGELRDRPPAEVVPRARAILRRSLERLARLEPPDELRARHEELVRALRRGDEIGSLRERDPAAARRHAAEFERLRVRSGELFGELGLTGCTGGGS